MLVTLALSSLAADIPLQSVSYEVTVTGPVADITVRQRFHNNSDTFVEATYVFPLQPDAAVDDLVMRVGDREIRGQIRERRQAKAEYDAAKAQGRAAALTEQERPNLFTQNVANLPPGGDIEVELHVVQPLHRENGSWDLIIPLVVGPRFVPGSVVDAERILPPVSEVDTGVRATIRADLQPGMPFAHLDSPTHTVDRVDDHGWTTIETGPVPMSRDFVLRWDLGAKEPIGAAIRQGEYVLVYLEPPEQPKREQVVPRELVWVVDTSCSMSGEPLELAKQAMDAAFDGMDTRDSFWVMDFEDSTSSLSPRPLPATADNKLIGRTYVDAFVGSGGTNLLSAIDASLSLPEDPSRQRFVMFLTDGFIGNEQQILGRIEDLRGDTHVFPIGLGSSSNRYLLDEMGISGQGRTVYSTLGEDPKAAVASVLDAIGRPVLSRVHVDWGVKGVESYPARIPDLFAGQPLWVTAKVPTGAKSVTVKGRLGTGTYTKTLPIIDGGDGDALATLFGRSRIAVLERQLHWGEDAEIQAEILATALEYRMMSRYTSFVAIDRRIINPTGEMRHVDQPVAIPDGVEYDAAVSREWTPPGDPLLTVDVPADALAVVAFYPWGQTARLRWDPLRKRYYHRFLVPQRMPDGDLTVRLAITLADGRIERRNQVIHVDGAAPELDVEIVRGDDTTTVTIRPDEPLRSVVVQPKGRPDLRRRVDFVQDLPEVVFVLPGQWDAVEIDAKDRAMNTIHVVSR